MELFRGSGVAIVTPFNDDFTINYDKLGELIEYHISNGTDAIIICGTTGEASILTDEEQVSCVEYTVKKVNKRIPVIAGAGSNDTKHAVKLAKDCENVGADALLLVTPYYNKTTQRGLINHYTIIAENVNIPIILYNVPGRTGLKIAPETCYELSKIKNIIGLKEASGDMSYAIKVANLCGPDFTLYSGNDDVVLPILSIGGKGVISVLANVAPKETHDMVMDFLNGDIEKARDMQVKALPLINALFCEVNPIPVKAALNMLGFGVGKCQLPLYDMEECHLKSLEKELKDFGLLK